MLSSIILKKLALWSWHGERCIGSPLLHTWSFSPRHSERLSCLQFLRVFLATSWSSHACTSCLSRWNGQMSCFGERWLGLLSCGSWCTAVKFPWIEGCILFDLVVVRHRVDEEGAEEADHTERDQKSVASEICVARHGETPEWPNNYFMSEYLWKRKPMLETTMWLTYAKRRLVGW